MWILLAVYLILLWLQNHLLRKHYENIMKRKVLEFVEQEGYCVGGSVHNGILKHFRS